MTSALKCNSLPLFNRNGHWPKINVTETPHPPQPCKQLKRFCNENYDLLSCLHRCSHFVDTKPSFISMQMYNAPSVLIVQETTPSHFNHCMHGLISSKATHAKQMKKKSHDLQMWLSSVFMPLICFSRFVTDLFHQHPSVFLIPRSRRAKLKNFARKPREEAKKRVMSSRVCGKSLIPMFFHVLGGAEVRSPFIFA